MVHSVQQEGIGFRPSARRLQLAFAHLGIVTMSEGPDSCVRGFSKVRKSVRALRALTKQLPGLPLKAEGVSGHRASGGTQCNACYMAELRERKRKAQQAEQKGKQTIQQAFAAAAAKKLKQE